MSAPGIFLLLLVATAAMETPDLDSWVRGVAVSTTLHQPSAAEPTAEAAPLSRLELGPDAPRVLDMPKDASVPRECNATSCFRKCCNPGYTRESNRCVKYNVTFDPLILSAVDPSLDRNLTNFTREEYYLVVGMSCSGEWFRIDWENIGNSSTFSGINENGTLSVFEDDGSYLVITTYELNQYCAEYTEDGNTTAYVCRDAIQEAGAFAWLYTFGLLVSVLCLLVTLVVYVVIDSLRDLHGKALVGHVGTLAIAYLLLVAVQSSEDGDDSKFGPVSCRGFAFAIHFLLLCSFFWLHVMCIDALWGVLNATGCSPVPYPRAKKWKWLAEKRFWAAEAKELDEKSEAIQKEEEKNLERRVFFMYCIYVSCLSSLPVLLASVQDLRPTIPATYLDYNMKLHLCPFDEDKPSLKYFFSIVGVIELVNIIIFIVIAVKAWSFPWNTTGPQRVPKQKARMCFILFLLMSSNWITDLISWSVGGRPAAWIMLHAFNILEGLITFCIFVLEDRVKDCIKRKWPKIKWFKRILRCCNEKSKEDIENPEETTLMPQGAPVARPLYK